jgi:hypothetical protein
MVSERHPRRLPGSLHDRLIAIATLARQKADSYPAGNERNALLRKAEQTERSAAIEAWITSPGAPPPE